MSRIFLPLVLLISVVNGDGDAPYWNYYGETAPDMWPSVYEQCGMTSQSPINIDSNVVEYWDELGCGIGFSSDYDKYVTGLILKNNGHTAQVDLSGLEAFIFGGGLPGTYKLAQFHFHWGANDSVGSEHTLNGRAYPDEIHFVHYNTMYSDLSSAVDKHQGLAVLGFFVEISDQQNLGFQQILSHLNDVSHPGDGTYSLDAMSVGSMLPTDLRYFYRYEGSLTTPPCYQSVVWTIFDSKIKMTSQSVAQFRALWEDDDETHKIEFNYRPVQPLNGRVIHTNNPMYDVGPDDDDAGVQHTAGFLLILSPIITSLITLL